jgi:hypothetical protein
LTSIKEPKAVLAGGEEHEGRRHTPKDEDDRFKLAASVHEALMATDDVQTGTHQDTRKNTSWTIKQEPKGFVNCPSCNKLVALDAKHKIQQPLVFNYFGVGMESHGDQKVSPNVASTPPRGQSPLNSGDISRPASRPSSASVPAQALQELADLKQQLLQVQGERQREKEQQQNALEAADTALREALAANTIAKEATPVVAAPSAAVEESDKDNELKHLREQLTAAEQKLAASEQELATARANPIPVVPPATSCGDAPSAPGKPLSAPTSRPPSGVRRAPSTTKSTAASTATKKENAAKNTAPKVDAVEFQNMLDDLTSLKVQLESATAEAATAKAQQEQANKAKEGESACERQTRVHMQYSNALC